MLGAEDHRERADGEEEDLGEVDTTAPAGRRRPRERRRGPHALRGGGLGQVLGRARAEHAALAEVEVAHGRGDLAVAEEALDGVQIRPRLQQVSGVGMAQRVNAALLADAGAGWRAGGDASVSSRRRSAATPLRD